MGGGLYDVQYVTRPWNQHICFLQTGGSLAARRELLICKTAFKCSSLYSTSAHLQPLNTAEHKP